MQVHRRVGPCSCPLDTLSREACGHPPEGLRCWERVSCFESSCIFENLESSVERTVSRASVPTTPRDPHPARPPGRTRAASPRSPAPAPAGSAACCSGPRVPQRRGLPFAMFALRLACPLPAPPWGSVLPLGAPGRRNPCRDTWAWSPGSSFAPHLRQTPTRAVCASVRPRCSEDHGPPAVLGQGPRTLSVGVKRFCWKLSPLVR